MHGSCRGPRRRDGAPRWHAAGRPASPRPTPAPWPSWTSGRPGGCMGEQRLDAARLLLADLLERAGGVDHEVVVGGGRGEREERLAGPHEEVERLALDAVAPGEPSQPVHR